MERLDKSRPFGKVSPPLDVAGCDVPAHYEQGGRLYDAHGHVLMTPEVRNELNRRSAMAAASPAAPIDAPSAPQAQTGGAATAPDQSTAAFLLAVAPTMPYATLVKRARLILGNATPTGKKAIMDALANAAGAKPVAVPATPAAAASGPASATVEQPPAQSNVGAPVSDGLDLTAWGRGQTNYLIGELRKAFRERYHVNLTERRDMVDLLITEKVITAEEARNDVRA